MKPLVANADVSLPFLVQTNLMYRFKLRSHMQMSIIIHTPPVHQTNEDEKRDTLICLNFNVRSSNTAMLIV